DVNQAASEALQKDLELTKPRFIVDAARLSIQMSHPNVSVYWVGFYPPLERLLKKQYVSKGQFDGCTIYERLPAPRAAP
ncbi:MAG: hypothetical protein ACRDD1_07320, partial [Planctomycetia bacterium]